MAIKVSKNGNSGDASNIIYQPARIKTSEKKAKFTFFGENAHEPVTVSLEDLPKVPHIPESSSVESCLVVYDIEKQEVIAINQREGRP